MIVEPERAGNSHAETWQLLLKLRWPVGLLVAVAFAVGQIVENLLLQNAPITLLIDAAFWGVIGGVAVWWSLTWASRQEQRYEANLEQSLQEQQELNRQLQRANSHLALLRDINRQIAASSTLDEIIDMALTFPQRLIRAQAASLMLIDAAGALETRAEGFSTAILSQLRESFGITMAMAQDRHPRLLKEPRSTSDTIPGTHLSCLFLPLHDGLAPIGWIELYISRPVSIADDEMALLETITTEMSEAVVSARRRSREERAIYELERAIAEERARIARDIHDGHAQSLAFLRMRVDLWQDWIESDQDRLREEFMQLKQTLRVSIRELRRAIFALRPVQFDELGFVGGLRRYIVEFAGQQGWESHVDLAGAPPALSPELEAICFRVIQEALNNAAKHANATRIEIVIGQVDHGLRLVVRDNGCGFEPGRISECSVDHMGLRQMHERVSIIRGQLVLLSRPGAGTELRAWIPLPTNT